MIDKLQLPDIAVPKGISSVTVQLFAEILSISAIVGYDALRKSVIFTVQLVGINAPALATVRYALFAGT